MPAVRDNVRGILAMLACCLAYILNDSMVKAAGETLPFGQILVLRGVLASAVIAVIAWHGGAFVRWRALFDRGVVLRGLAESMATLLYIGALFHIPLAVASSIAQAAPLMMTAVGALFLGEPVGWRRWTAVVVGFLGIMIIVRPGAEGFDLWAVVALVAVVAMVVRDFVTRAVPADTPTMLVTLATSVAVTLLGVVLSLLGAPWVALGPAEAGLVGGAAVFFVAGTFFLVVAMRHGEVSVVAPFRYAFIPYAVLIGWLVWGDVPDGPTVLGIAIVVATGVYTFLRERRLPPPRRPATRVEPAT